MVLEARVTELRGAFVQMSPREVPFMETGWGLCWGGIVCVCVWWGGGEGSIST